MTDLISNLTLIRSGQFDQTPYQNILKSLNGMSKPAIMHAINSAVTSMNQNEYYLEVGTHQGCTLIGALINNDHKAYAVDNFSQFSEMGNRTILYQNLQKFDLFDRVKFFEENYVDFFNRDDLPKFGVYFYDGNHSEEDTFLGLELAWPHLKKDAVIFLDDYSWACVQNGIDKFLELHTNIGVVYTICHKSNDPVWHNGLCVLQRIK